MIQGTINIVAMSETRQFGVNVNKSGTKYGFQGLRRIQCHYLIALIGIAGNVKSPCPLYPGPDAG